MREVLAHALTFAMSIQSGRVDAGGPGHVFEFAVHPVGRGGDGLMRVVVLGDALSHPLDPLAGRA